MEHAVATGYVTFYYSNITMMHTASVQKAPVTDLFEGLLVDNETCSHGILQRGRGPVVDCVIAVYVLSTLQSEEQGSSPSLDRILQSARIQKKKKGKRRKKRG
jgi:hypothetical protein